MKKRKCLLHRSSVQHEKAAALIARYIALFSVIQVRYGTLTHSVRSSGGVVVRACVCQILRSDSICVQRV